MGAVRVEGAQTQRRVFNILPVTRSGAGARLPARVHWLVQSFFGRVLRLWSVRARRPRTAGARRAPVRTPGTDKVATGRPKVAAVIIPTVTRDGAASPTEARAGPRDGPRAAVVAGRPLKRVSAPPLPTPPPSRAGAVKREGRQGPFTAAAALVPVNEDRIAALVAPSAAKATAGVEDVGPHKPDGVARLMGPRGLASRGF